MTTLQNFWQMLSTSFSARENEAQLEYMTRVILGMIMVVLVGVSIPVLIGWGLIRFDSEALVIILLLDTVIIGVWILSFQGYWRICSYIPPILFITLGLYGTYTNGMLTAYLLSYVMAIILAFMLHGVQAQWLTVSIIIAAYLTTGWINNPMILTTEERLTISITVCSSFVGVALLVWFSSREMHSALTYARSKAFDLQKARDHLVSINQTLQNEIHEKETAARALQRSQQRYQLIFDTMLNGFALYEIVSQTQDGVAEFRLSELNPAFEEIIGMREEEVIGKSIHQLLPEMETLWSGIANLPLGTNNPIRFISYLERAEKNYEVYAYSPQKGQLATIFLDITERVERQREMEAIVQVAATLRTAQTRSEMLPVILQQVAELIKADSVAIGLQDSTTGETIYEQTFGIISFQKGLRRKEGEGLTGHVMETGEIYVNNDIRNDPYLIPSHVMPFRYAMAAIPLISKDKPIGVLIAGRNREFGDADIRLLLAIGDMSANAIQRSTLYEETELRMQRLATLHTVEKALTTNYDIHTALQLVLDQVTGCLGIHAADILLYDPQIQTLTYVSGKGFQHDSLYHTAMRIGKGFASRVAIARQAVYIADISKEIEAISAQSVWMGDEKFTSYYGIPLIAKGKVNGVFEIYQREPLDLSTEWSEFMETLVRQIAIAIDNASLVEDLQKTNLELTLAYDTTLEGWAKALELRDKETEGHSQNVTTLCLELAQRMGIHSKELVNIRRGALLHDIGKMGIPDQILLKPSALSKEEWQIMQLHPTYAYELLYPIAFLRPALEIPYCHHEKWDGSGYPRGLKWDEIPLAARIFAVIDVWDALRSDRPYRAAWSELDAIAYIKDQSGIHFDPQVVMNFLELIEIYNQPLG